MTAVAAKAPREHVAFLGWGVFHLVFMPPFDVVDPHLWGQVVGLVATAGFFATLGYYAGRSRVRITDRSPWWAWPLITLWWVLTWLFAARLDDVFPLAHTVAGVAGALPPLGWGARLRRTA